MHPLDLSVRCYERHSLASRVPECSGEFEEGFQLLAEVAVVVGEVADSGFASWVELVGPGFHSGGEGRVSWGGGGGGGGEGRIGDVHEGVVDGDDEDFSCRGEGGGVDVFGDVLGGAGRAWIEGRC